MGGGGRADLSRDRTHIDEDAAVAQRRRRRPRDAERAKEIGLEDRFRLRHGDVLHGSAYGKAGVVDQSVEPPRFFQDERQRLQKISALTSRPPLPVSM